MKPPGGDSHDIFGADFNGTPSHHRVLKPPGGGTSDIFNGPGLPSGGEPPRRVRNLQPASKLFVDEPDLPGTPNSKGPAPSTPSSHGNDSHWRLFGPPPPVAASPASAKTPNARIFATYDDHDGNPVTGEGYEDKNGTVSSRSSDAGSVASSVGSNNGAVNNNGLNNGIASQKARNRIPPGGYSSGFW